MSAVQSGEGPPLQGRSRELMGLDDFPPGFGTRQSSGAFCLVAVT